MSCTLPLLFATGCRQDMQDQPKFFPQRATNFYVDGRSVRPQVLHTVARGQLQTDSYLDTGLVNGKEADALPFPVTLALLERGQERYNIYCAPCHSRVGNGGGMIVQRGYRPAGDYHTARLENAPLGHFFNVISHGYGAMPDYSAQITAPDRWAIAAYIRALQLSQNAKQTDVANGSHVAPLPEIEAQEGFSSGFATDWSLPGTAVYGTPNHQDNGIPGEPMNAPGIGTGGQGTGSNGPAPAKAKPEPNPTPAIPQ